LSRFKHGTDYKKAFEEAVNEIIEKDIEDRAERIRAIDALIDEYVYAIGSAPDPVQLERLSNYILREELYDTYPDKVSRDEYPILSERQLARRMSGEAPLKLAEEVATDGKNYRIPKRRKRTLKESIFMDANVKSRNKERRKKYAAYTKPGPVITYSLNKNESND